MTSFIEVFQNNPMAVIFGAMGLACQLVWPVFSQRERILSVQFGIGANYGIQYALLDAWSGAGVCGLGATQTAVALFAGERTWLRKMGLFFLPVVAFVCYATWSGYSSLFALCACSLVMLGRLQKDTLRLRLFLLAAALIWALDANQALFLWLNHLGLNDALNGNATHDRFWASATNPADS